VVKAGCLHEYARRRALARQRSGSRQSVTAPDVVLSACSACAPSRARVRGQSPDLLGREGREGRALGCRRSWEAALSRLRFEPRLPGLATSAHRSGSTHAPRTSNASLRRPRGGWEAGGVRAGRGTSLQKTATRDLSQEGESQRKRATLDARGCAPDRQPGDDGVARTRGAGR